MTPHNDDVISDQRRTVDESDVLVHLTCGPTRLLGWAVVGLIQLTPFSFTAHSPSRVQHAFSLLAYLRSIPNDRTPTDPYRTDGDGTVKRRNADSACCTFARAQRSRTQEVISAGDGFIYYSEPSCRSPDPVRCVRDAHMHFTWCCICLSQPWPALSQTALSSAKRYRPVVEILRAYVFMPFLNHSNDADQALAKDRVRWIRKSCADTQHKTHSTLAVVAVIKLCNMSMDMVWSCSLYGVPYRSRAH